MLQMLLPANAPTPSGPTSLMQMWKGAQTDAEGWTQIRSIADTGAAHTVIRPDNVPGYEIKPSPMSRRGESYTSACSGEIENEGQVSLPTVSPEGVVTCQDWQVALVHKNLLSIGEECDKGQFAIFGKSGGILLNINNTGEMRRFARETEGYMVDHWVPPAEGFPRPGW